MNALSLFNPSITSDIFDDFDSGLSLLAPLSSNSLKAPRVDVRETKDAYIMDMDLPGLTQNDVEINMKDKVLSISSIKDVKNEETEKENGVQYLIRERRTSSFSRHFTMPNDIDSEKIEATFKNGMLTIKIPRKEESKSRQIEIKYS